MTTFDGDASVAVALPHASDVDVTVDLRDPPAVVPRGRRWSRVAIALVVSFVVTRAIAGYVSDHPLIYGPHRADGTGDVHLYDYWTWQLRHTAATAYHSLHIEYPPGALPF